MKIPVKTLLASLGAKFGFEAGSIFYDSQVSKLKSMCIESELEGLNYYLKSFNTFERKTLCNRRGPYNV